MPRFPRWVLVPFLLLLGLHQNFWMWGQGTIILGLPVNLVYHVGLCAVTPLLLWFVVRRAWPHFPDGE